MRAVLRAIPILLMHLVFVGVLSIAALIESAGMAILSVISFPSSTSKRNFDDGE